LNDVFVFAIVREKGGKKASLPTLQAKRGRKVQKENSQRKGEKK